MRASTWFTASLLLTGAFALAACGSMSSAPKPATFAATLNGASMVPPNATSGKGDATVSLDRTTKTISWKVNYSGLTGNATAEHFHGPAAPGANAGVALPIATGSVPNPAVGTAVLTDAQIADLTAGKWYIAIHTQANPGGEIRGQVTATN
jgi:hypothetical protein